MLTCVSLRRIALLSLGTSLCLSFPAEPAPAQQQIVESIIARVNEDVIFLSDLLREEKLLVQQVESQVVPDKRNKELENLQKKLIERMIEERLLEQKAKSLNIDIDERVDAAIERIKKDNKITSDAMFLQALQQQGFDYDTFRATMHYRLLQQVVLYQYVQPRLVITQQEQQDYYDQHREELRTPFEWTLFQLKALEQADTEGIREKIGRNIPPEGLGLDPDRADLKLTHIGPLQADQLRKDIRDLLDPKKIHTWLGPLRSENTTSWFWIESRQGGEIPSFDTIRKTIYDKIWKTKAEALRNTMLDDLKKNSYIEVYAKNLPEPYRTYYAKADVKKGKNHASQGHQ